MQKIIKLAEPVSISKAVIKIVKALLAMIASNIITITKFATAWALFAVITLIGFKNLLSIFENFSFFGWVTDRLADATGCDVQADDGGNFFTRNPERDTSLVD